MSQTPVTRHSFTNTDAFDRKKVSIFTLKNQTHQRCSLPFETKTATCKRQKLRKFIHPGGKGSSYYRALNQIDIDWNTNLPVQPFQILQDCFKFKDCLKKIVLKEQTSKNTALKEEGYRKDLIKEKCLKDSFQQQQYLKNTPLRDGGQKKAVINEKWLKNSFIQKQCFKKTPYRGEYQKKALIKEQCLRQNMCREAQANAKMADGEICVKFNSKSQILNRLKQQIDAFQKKNRTSKQNMHRHTASINSLGTTACSKQYSDFRNYSVENLTARSMQSPKNTLSLQSFIKLFQIGRGQYSIVYLAVEKRTNFICTLKAIKKTTSHQENIFREIKLLCFLRHPNIVPYYGSFSDSQHIYVIQEYCPGGPLLLPQSNRQKQTTIAEIFEAVMFLHSHGVLHRDLKPQNIVDAFGVKKVCDFGLAVYAGGQSRSTFCGTPQFISPQMILRQAYNEKTDVWGLGVLTYHILYGRVPFTVENVEDMQNIIDKQVYYPHDDLKMRSVVEAMLQKQSLNRPTMNKIMMMAAVQQCLKANKCNRIKE